MHFYLDIEDVSKFRRKDPQGIGLELQIVLENEGYDVRIEPIFDDDKKGQ